MTSQAPYIQFFQGPTHFFQESVHSQGNPLAVSNRARILEISVCMALETAYIHFFQESKHFVQEYTRDRDLK